MDSTAPKQVIIDFDNTIGIPGCDLDDALALLYLLGNPNLATVRAACTTYGNSTIDAVHENTRRLFKEWNLDLPLYRGGARADEPYSEAAHFLAREAATYPGELSIVATGSLTNLKGAALIDPHFFANVRDISIMGGITESLVINGRIMNELNLSCDAAATYAVLKSDATVNIITAQNCLPAFFHSGDFDALFGKDSWLAQVCAPWFATMSDWYEWNGFACWDLAAAAYLLQPELFTDVHEQVTLNERLFSVGFLETAASDAPQTSVNLPRIADAAALTKSAMESWQRALDARGM